jgi:hypothetical protein
MRKFLIIYEYEGTIEGECDAIKDVPDVIFDCMKEHEDTAADDYTVAEIKWRGKGGVELEDYKPKKKKKKDRRKRKSCGCPIGDDCDCD